MIKLNILAENRAKRRGILGEHGLSILVEIEGYKVLFDTGQTDVFSLNAKMDGIDLSMVDALVISHGHYDHTGGVPEFCRINKKALIYIHPDADICGVIGGMHLEKYSTEQLTEIAYGLKSAVAGKIIPLHCTGILASCYLKNSFGDNCLLLNSGDELILEE